MECLRANTGKLTHADRIARLQLVMQLPVDLREVFNRTTYFHGVLDGDPNHVVVYEGGTVPRHRPTSVLNKLDIAEVLIDGRQPILGC